MSDICHGKNNVATNVVENISNQQCHVHYNVQDRGTIAAQNEERKHVLLWDGAW